MVSLFFFFLFLLNASRWLIFPIFSLFFPPTLLMVSHSRTKRCKKENQSIETVWVNLKRFTVCSSVAALPQEEARCENLINMPRSGKPSCWIRQTWLLAQQIDSLNSTTEPNSALLRLFGGLVLCVWSCLSPMVTVLTTTHPQRFCYGRGCTHYWAEPHSASPLLPLGPLLSGVSSFLLQFNEK